MTRFLAIVILAAGCGTTESGNLLTRGMSAIMDVKADGANTTVTAELFSGTPDQLIFVKLTDGDQLQAFRGPEMEMMIETQIATIVGYSAVFTGNDDTQPFTINFERTVDAGAPTSMATLPPAFTLDAVPPTQSRAQSLQISWSPASADPLAYKVEGSCIQTVQNTLPANASALIIPANAIMKMQGTNIPDTCTATLTMTRAGSGSLDPGFGKGGSITAEQERTAQFTTTL
jgi:hypothetical protein